MSCCGERGGTQQRSACAERCLQGAGPDRRSEPIEYDRQSTRDHCYLSLEFIEDRSEELAEPPPEVDQPCRVRRIRDGRLESVGLGTEGGGQSAGRESVVGTPPPASGVACRAIVKILDHEAVYGGDDLGVIGEAGAHPGAEGDGEYAAESASCSAASFADARRLGVAHEANGSVTDRCAQPEDRREFEAVDRFELV